MQHNTARVVWTRHHQCILLSSPNW